MADGQHMQNGIGRSPRRRDDCHSVFQGLPGDQIGRAEVSTQDIEDHSTGQTCRFRLVRMNSGQIVQPHWRQTEDGERRSHRVRGELPSGETAESIGSALAQAAQVDPESVSARTVSPSFGDQVAGKARRALVVFFILIALYLTLRFEWKMALGALLAVAPDIVLTVGIYALFQFEISPATVVAFLTIMGYSLYDTIVVFDRPQ